MKYKKIVCLLFVGLFHSLAIFSQSFPNTINGLALWLSADSIQQTDGSAIETWNSNANLGGSVSQAVATSRPTLIKTIPELNNHAVVRFDGNDYLDGGTSLLNIGNKGQTFFIVAKNTSTIGSFFAKSLYGPASYRFFLIYEGGKLYVSYGITSTLAYSAYGTSKLGKYDVLSGSIDVGNGGVSFFQEGSGVQNIESKLVSNFTSNFNFLVGAYNNKYGTLPPVSGYYLNGDIAEMIFYDHALTKLERQSIENYLRSKYFPGTERPQFSLGNDTIVTNTLKPLTLAIPDSSYFTGAQIAWNTGESTKSIQVNQSGTYSVNVVDSWGYIYGDTIEVLYPSIFQLQNQTICMGDTITWDSGLSGDYTYLWSTGETSRAIKISKEGDYSVQVTDNQGYSATTKSVHVAVDSFTTQASLGADRQICKGNRIGLEFGAEKAVHYTWQDGSTASTIAPQVSGTYSVTVTDVVGCVVKDTVAITIQGVAPIADFSYTNACETESTVFTSQSYTLDDAQIVKNIWIFENDTINGDIVEHTFSTYGAHIVQLITDNDEGCSGILHDTIYINAMPQVSFSPSLVCQYTPREIVPTATIAEGTIVSLTWNIAGETTQDSVAVVSSDTVGIIPVTLSLTSNTGCTASFSDGVRVVASTKITIEQTGHCIGDTLLFADATEYSAYNQMQSAYWLMDDTLKANYSNMVWYKPTDTLSHTIALYVKTMNGCTNVREHSFFVHKIPQPALDTVFACVNSDIVLKNMGTSVDSIRDYRWSIADSLRYDLEHPIISLQHPGTYSLSLEVGTNVSCYNSATSVIVVDEPPFAKFTFFPEKGADPLFVTFTNKSESASSYKWVFADSVESEEVHPTFLYLDKATSYAKLIAYSDHMCADSVIVKIPLTLADERLQVVDLQTSIDADGFISNTVQILNSGNVSITNIDLVVSSSDIPAVMESWEGELKPNEVLVYTFVSKQYDMQKSMPSYVCVDAEIVDPQGYQSYYSDRYCIDKTNDFMIYNVSPNPAKREMTLRFSTNARGTVTIICVDETGKIGMKNEFPDIEPGYHTLELDIMQLARGTYSLYVEQNNKRRVARFIKE